MKRFLAQITAAFALSLPTFAKQPDILFLFVDDFAYDCTGYSGNPVVKTPNIDRLKKRGTLFSHAYNMGSWTPAVCAASRAMLNTGLYLWQTDHLNIEKQANDGKLWSQLMEPAGYRTWMQGKWHVMKEAHTWKKLPPSTCFDSTGTIRGGMPKQNPDGYNRPLSPEDKKWLPWDPKQGGFWEGGKHWTEVSADEGTDYINKHKESERPLFMYLAFSSTHDPHQAPKKYVDMYPPQAVDLPAGYMPEYPYKEKIGSGRHLRDEQLAPFPRTEYAIKVNRGEYYAQVTHLDAQIGRVLDALEKSGRAGNTIIILSADHGLAVGHHGFMGKQNMYDHSMRVPLLFTGPGIPQGKVIETPVYYQDLVPTAIELAGAEVPQFMQFKSLLPLIKGDTTEHYPAIYGAYLKLQRMVVKDGWKLIYYPKVPVYLLYNLNRDPQELHNLAEDPAYKEKLTEMKTELKRIEQSMGDPLTKPKNRTNKHTAPSAGNQPANQRKQALLSHQTDADAYLNIYQPIIAAGR